VESWLSPPIYTEFLNDTARSIQQYTDEIPEAPQEKQRMIEISDKMGVIYKICGKELMGVPCDQHESYIMKNSTDTRRREGNHK